MKRLVEVVATQGCLKVARLFGRDGFEVAYTAGDCSHPASGQGAEHGLAGS